MNKPLSNHNVAAPNLTGNQRILVVEDDAGLRDCVQCLLRTKGFATVIGETVEQGLRALRSDDFDLVITDLRLPDSTGLDLIRGAKELDPETPVILMTSYSSVESAIEALRLGAVDYLIKPFDNSEFLHSVQRALDERRIKRENRILKRSLKIAYGADDLIGESPAIKRVMDLIKRVAPTDASVLIQGESGTGKELVARAIHATSPRADGSFVAINCGAIPEDLMESELFGHAKGAFTGATGHSEGLIREAQDGTLLLDEISELPLNLQVKLLRVLQEREVRPIGGTRTYQVDVRFLAATNRDLKAQVKEGTFREDLYFRLNVINIWVPPLRERPGDVMLLARRFIQQHSRKLGKQVRGIGDDLMEFLANYHWPGNVRELENLIERSVILADSDVLSAKYLGDMGTAPGKAVPSDSSGTNSESLFEHKLSVEEYIQEFVRYYQDGYNETELARMLGIGRKALWARRRKWHMHGKSGSGGEDRSQARSAPEVLGEPGRGNRRG